ncbi:histone deacetylase [candidate division KSB1 bacterium]|nr:histone deacetylase [candidate division KSB1 bacterium]NIR72832.1 histone deacetylase [candidate division KSB1 bacterium]NIS26872.1 histone deacetylase [candidate division KSB1 bacterium]NIT73668.1 histone deacetylase [candidate division KSB1 bacterium]NIU27539.1 histone deacetylase [candidate division KSB1 bacterium]
MSKTGFIYDDSFLYHKTGPGHPERPERLQRLMDYLNGSEVFASLTRLQPKEAELDWIEEIHLRSYIETIQGACKSGLQFLDADTVVSEDSYRATLLAVGSTVEACNAVMNSEVENAFCAVRPPGHHAERSRAMGFCLFNNVAIAARYLQKHCGIEKVCIIDWDVHHGNGTQNAFYDDATVFYVSIHQYPWFPGTGKSEDRGMGEGEGTTLNLPSTAGLGDQEYLKMFEKQIMPSVRDFNPDFILISAGFDAHRDDPLASMQVTEDGFAHLTEAVKSLAKECSEGRFVSLLEGGYNLNAMAKSVEKHLLKMQE